MHCKLAKRTSSISSFYCFSYLLSVLHLHCSISVPQLPFQIPKLLSRYLFSISCSHKRLSDTINLFHFCSSYIYTNFAMSISFVFLQHSTSTHPENVVKAYCWFSRWTRKIGGKKKRDLRSFCAKGKQVVVIGFSVICHCALFIWCYA